MANPNRNLRVCVDRIVPDVLTSDHGTAHKKLVTAALLEHKVARPRELFRDLDPNQPLDAARMAIVNGKKWPTGSVLKCRFLEGSAAQKAKAQQMAKKWTDYANLDIQFVTTPDEQVRIAFTPGQGSWSAIGSDSLNAAYFPKHQPTMNFGWLDETTADDEWERVVVHEFGHALGCIHEHQQPNETLNWNRDAVYAYFSGPPNYWSKDEIDSNILEKYSAQGLTATVFDRASIMLYQFPAELFNGGPGTPNNTHLSKLDESLIGQMYPKK
jgi:serralysin